MTDFDNKPKETPSDTLHVEVRLQGWVGKLFIAVGSLVLVTGASITLANHDEWPSLVFIVPLSIFLLLFGLKLWRARGELGSSFTIIDNQVELRRKRRKVFESTKFTIGSIAGVYQVDPSEGPTYLHIELTNGADILLGEYSEDQSKEIFTYICDRFDGPMVWEGRFIPQIGDNE